ncbi:MAG: DUF4159 domain-containing protein [Bacteroidetes bacterium]|nr:DUF4159 domain-containing protein [Bacteroidota bacterium]
MRGICFFLCCLFPALVGAQPQSTASFKVAKLKYDGGGDWYANSTSLPNLFRYVRENSRTNIFLGEEVVEPGSAQIFQYPLVYMTGHGNIVFGQAEAQNMRRYLEAGGFFFIDDNYGLNVYIIREMKKVFPEHEFVELPFTHPIYHQMYYFAEGMPKIHEHDGKPAQLFGIVHQGRLVCVLTYESDLGDGWEDRSVHNNPEEVRLKAFQMGANILFYVLHN